MTTANEVLSGLGITALSLFSLVIVLGFFLAIIFSYYYLLPKVQLPGLEQAPAWVFTITAISSALSVLVILWRSGQKSGRETIAELLINVAFLAVSVYMAVCLWNNNCTQVQYTAMLMIIPIVALQWVGGVAFITGMAEGAVEMMIGK